MPWLASLMQRLVFETEVSDKTGLTGVYDFSFEFAPLSPAMPASGESSAAPSLFTAIQSIGLKLEARKGPMKFLIVDHADKLTEH